MGRKNSEDKRADACCCGTENREMQGAGCCPKDERPCCAGGNIRIKVLGAGCKACHAQYESVRAAVAALGLSAEVEYITDMEKVMAYGVMSMPAIVVNDQVVSMGKVLKAADVEKLLHKLGY